ncbi:hypothetical protein JOF29_005631 [Kribbella aluminosa]|uniref:Uncharacterized protein n=1 Tax=Kribbella aluminosa TaxID=416017 RepID=A0ABS4USJ5_9ACTN|nr:hypothetical protein [Kribbella aluminosa]
MDRGAEVTAGWGGQASPAGTGQPTVTTLFALYAVVWSVSAGNQTR